MANSSPSSSGIGFFGLLAVAFIVLKLCGVIGWSWWWVLAPVWGPLAILVLILVVIGLCVLMAELTGQRRKRRW